MSREAKSGLALCVLTVSWLVTLRMLPPPAAHVGKPDDQAPARVYDPAEPGYWGRLPQEIEMSGYARVFPRRIDFHDACWLEWNHEPYGNQSGSYWLHGGAYPVDTRDTGWLARKWRAVKDRRVWVRGTLVLAKRPEDVKPNRLLRVDQVVLYHEPIPPARQFDAAEVLHDGTPLRRMTGWRWLSDTYDRTRPPTEVSP